MANSKQRLQGLIGTHLPPPIQKGTPYAVAVKPADAPAPEAHTTLQRGASFTVSTAENAAEPMPEAVLALRVALREIAWSYIGARRRSGRALLEAARWLSEARAATEHGEWYDFLAATETTADTAERLLRIYERSLQHPAFAAAVADGRINQSTAERLARESTPPAVIDVVLTADQPPTVAAVDRAIRAAKKPMMPEVETLDAGQIPQCAGSELGDAEQIPQCAGFELGDAGQIPQCAGFELGDVEDDTQTLVALQKGAAILVALTEHAARIPKGKDTTQALDAIERALNTFRAALAMR